MKNAFKKINWEFILTATALMVIATMIYTAIQYGFVDFITVLIAALIFPSLGLLMVIYVFYNKPLSEKLSEDKTFPIHIVGTRSFEVLKQDGKQVQVLIIPSAWKDRYYVIFEWLETTGITADFELMHYKDILDKEDIKTNKSLLKKLKNTFQYNENENPLSVTGIEVTEQLNHNKMSTEENKDQNNGKILSDTEKAAAQAALEAAEGDQSPPENKDENNNETPEVVQYRVKRKKVDNDEQKALAIAVEASDTPGKLLEAHHTKKRFVWQKRQ